MYLFINPHTGSEAPPLSLTHHRPRITAPDNLHCLWAVGHRSRERGGWRRTQRTIVSFRTSETFSWRRARRSCYSRSGTRTWRAVCVRGMMRFGGSRENWRREIRLLRDWDTQGWAWEEEEGGGTGRLLLDWLWWRSAKQADRGLCCFSGGQVEDTRRVPIAVDQDQIQPPHCLG